MRDGRKRWRFAIAGAGNIAGIHAQAIAHIARAELVVVHSRSEARARALAEQHGAEWTTDWQRAVARSDVDIVCVCTPSGTHLEYAMQAACQGKHVIVEKPVEVTLPRVDAMIAACRANRVVLSAIFPSRLRPGVVAARRAIEAGRLGRLAICDASVKWYRDQAYYDAGGWRGTWALDGGGALMNQSIHSVDLLQYLAGPVVSVYGRTGTLSHRMETEDVAVALLEFAHGGFGLLEGSTAAWPGLPSRIELSGDRGTIVLEDARITTWKLADATADEVQRMLSLDRARGSGASDPMGIGYEGHLVQIEDTIEAIETGRAPLVDGAEGRKAIEIIAAVYRSQRTGHAVSLPLV